MKIYLTGFTTMSDCTDIDSENTIDIIEYGFRSVATIDERTLARKIQKLRVMAFELAEQLINEGHNVQRSILEEIDVSMEINTTERLCVRKI